MSNLPDLPAEDQPPARHDPHARLRERMTRSNPTAFNNPAIREFYVDFFMQLCMELETVPGFGAASMAMAERYAFLVATMRQFDEQESPLDPIAYQQLILRFTQIFDRLLKGRDERTADDAFRRQFAGSLINAVAEAIEEVVVDREQSLALQAAIASKLRAVSTDTSVTQR